MRSLPALRSNDLRDILTFGNGSIVSVRSSSPSPPTSIGPAVVLVVDDADDNRILYASTIAEAGYPVEEARNGQEALERIGARAPAVVVMDLSMPVMDGWEAMRRIKQDPRTAGIRLIALTAHATHFGLREATAAGADAVLTKPCLPQDLLGVI